jgi:tetratricopeptide (TPR) repeat protein
VALAAAVLALVVFGGSGAAWWWQQRTAMVRDVEAALAEATGHREARRWPEVRAALERAQGRLGNAGPEALRARVQHAKADADLVAELEDIRLLQAETRDGHFDMSAAVPRYAAAFGRYGLDVETAKPLELAGQLRGHSLREELLAALRDWARYSREDGARQRLVAVLAAVEPALTEFDRQWQAANRARDRAALERLADEADPARLPAATLDLMALDLDALEAVDAAVRLLRRGQPRYPADFWLNHDLGRLLGSTEPSAAVRYLTAALAVRPSSPGVHLNLGRALHAHEDLAGAVAAYREALRLDPKYAQAHVNLGCCLYDQKDMAGAAAAFREALRHDPKYAHAHFNLGLALSAQGDVAGAVAAYREAVRLDPKLAKAHFNLGNALREQGDVAGAVAAYREILRLDPKDARTHNNLGIALKDQGDVAGAVAAYREALRLDPKAARAHYNLGLALEDQGNVAEAIAAYREALRLDPGFAMAHNSLGNALKDQGELAGAEAAYREALRLNPKFAEAQCSLGNALRRRGQFAAALEALRRGHELGSQQPGWLYPSAQWVREAERLVALEPKLPDLLAGTARPADAAEALAYAQVCHYKHRYAAAARSYADAFAADPNLADDLKAQYRYVAAFSAARAAAGQSEDAGKLEAKERSRLRQQALAWLRADLTLWGQQPDADTPADRARRLRMLRHWQHDPDLAGLRDAPELAKLPADEQEAWRKLWADVEALLNKAP